MDGGGARECRGSITASWGACAPGLYFNACILLRREEDLPDSLAYRLASAMGGQLRGV